MGKRSLPLLVAVVLLAGLVALLYAQSGRPGPAALAQGGNSAGAVRAAEAVEGGVAAIPPPPVKRQFTLVAVGDIMTDRSVGKAIANRGASSILEKVTELTRMGDVSFANLESPLSDKGPHDPSRCVFRARPETVKVLVHGGFDVVSLANNHTLNAGREGILQTLETLEKHNIKYCGAHRERERSGEVVVLEAGQGPVKAGFISATDLSFEHGSYNKVQSDRSNLIAQIKAAREQCDLLFVSLHWGDEYHDFPNQRQKDTAHLALDAGADVILGHHPHTLQGVEVYKGKLILYSMGNFVFDQREGERMESCIFHLTWIEGWGWLMFAKPVWIPHSRMGPIYPAAERRDRILSRLVRISKPFGTELTVKDGKAWLKIPWSAPAAPGERLNPTG